MLLEKKLNEVGLNDYEFIPKKIPLFDVSYKTTENSTGVKLLYGVINLLSSEANLDVEETTKQKTKKIGEQIMNYELQIRW